MYYWFSFIFTLLSVLGDLTLLILRATESRRETVIRGCWKSMRINKLRSWEICYFVNINKYISEKFHYSFKSVHQRNTILKRKHELKISCNINELKTCFCVWQTIIISKWRLAYIIILLTCGHKGHLNVKYWRTFYTYQLSSLVQLSWFFLLFHLAHTTSTGFLFQTKEYTLRVMAFESFIFQKYTQCTFPICCCLFACFLMQ